MGFLTTKSFCCCLPLKTGGLVLGLLSLGLCIAGSIEITVKYFRDASHHSYNNAMNIIALSSAEFATKTGKNDFFSFVFRIVEVKTMNLREF